MDIDTRLLRYFAAVAAEGNLTRAAERLFVSQPTLTKQIKQLESQLGVRLFTRSRAGMTLTRAGQTLANSTPAVLAGWDQALRETKAAASRAARVLRVGFISSAANEATQHIIAAFARRRPGWRVDMQQAAWADPTAGLASGDVDAALLRLPFPGQDDMRIEVLLTEPRWAALPATHPLATAITSSSMSCGTNRSSPPPPKPASGAITGWPPAKGITYRPVTGVSPSQVGVAWPPRQRRQPRRPGLRPLLPGQQAARTTTKPKLTSRNNPTQPGHNNVLECHSIPLSSWMSVPRPAPADLHRTSDTTSGCAGWLGGPVAAGVIGSR